MKTLSCLAMMGPAGVVTLWALGQPGSADPEEPHGGPSCPWPP